MGMNKSTLITTAVVATVVVGFILYVLQPSYGIILRATNTDITPQKWTAIKGVLDAHSVTPGADSREKLYRVREFNGGVPVGLADEGTLDKVELLEDYDLTLADLKSAGFTGHAFQIGVGNIERSKRVPKGPDTPLAHHRLNILESQKMVEAVNPYL